MIDREFVQRKLQLIAEELDRLLESKSDTFEDLMEDFVKQAAVGRILERIVNRAVDINQHIIARASTGDDEKATRLTYRDTFLARAKLGAYSHEFAESIAKSAGLRNVLVHEYNHVDPLIVYESIRSCLEDYRSYIDHVRAYALGD